MYHLCQYEYDISFANCKYNNIITARVTVANMARNINCYNSNIDCLFCLSFLCNIWHVTQATWYAPSQWVCKPTEISACPKPGQIGRVVAGRAFDIKMGEVMGMPLVRMGWRPPRLLVPLPPSSSPACLLYTSPSPRD